MTPDENLKSMSNESMIELFVALKEDKLICDKEIERNKEVIAGTNEEFNKWSIAYCDMVGLDKLLEVVAPRLRTLFGSFALEHMIPEFEKEIQKRKEEGKLTDKEEQKFVRKTEKRIVQMRKAHKEDSKAEKDIFDGRDPNSLFDNMN